MIANDLNFPINFEICGHEKEIVSYFGKQGVINQKRKKNNIKNVFVCFTNRCGSNYLVELLGSTDYFPVGEEFFNWDTVINNSRIRKINSFDEYCLFLLEKMRKNNFFISKVSWQQLFMISKLGQIPNLIDSPKFILIKRDNLIDQAISLLIADQTKAWTSYQSSEKNMIQYDYQRILLIIQKISESNTMFETYFKLFEARYLTLLYEDIYNNPIATIEHICDFLKITCKHPELKKMRVKKQRNKINQEFKERFMYDLKQDFALSFS